MKTISKLKAFDDKYRHLYGHVIRPEFWISIAIMLFPLGASAYALGPEQATLVFPFVMMALFGGFLGNVYMNIALDKAEDGA